MHRSCRLNAPLSIWIAVTKAKTGGKTGVKSQNILWKDESPNKKGGLKFDVGNIKNVGKISLFVKNENRIAYRPKSEKAESAIRFFC